MRALLNALEEAVARQALYRSNMKERYNDTNRNGIFRGEKINEYCRDVRCSLLTNPTLG
ncbi:hypothetical protein [Proteus phage VTCCBPA139]|nr:hypothetical protein [Proteus phage VTCCBPA139]